MATEIQNENGSSFLLRGSRPILMIVVLIPLGGHGYPQNGAMPSFFLNSKSSMLGLSSDTSLVSFFPLEGGSNGQNKKPLI